MAEGETLQIPLCGDDANNHSALKWSTSDTDHAVVDKAGYVTAVQRGEATITVQDKKGDTIDRVAKIKIYIAKGGSLITGTLQTLLPLYIDEKTRQILNADLSIVTLQDILDKAATKADRQNIAKKTGVTESTVGVWYRQAVLWNTPGITREICYLAAMAGIRNAYDLSRAEFEDLKNIFRILENSIVLPEGTTFIPPKDDDLLVVINNALKSSPQENMYYYVIGGEDPEPTFLFVAEDDLIKSDTQILQEGLEFLNNIKMSLPLPTTISGTVVMKEEGNKGKSGLKVTLTGIANATRDKTENEDELFCYTDEDGRFTIVMPDRYNMQETVKFTVSENTDDNASMALKSSSDGAYSVNQSTFIRRASEIIDHEYVKIITDAAKGTTEIKNASDILSCIDRIQVLSGEIEDLEEDIYEVATGNAAKTLAEALQKKTEAEDSLKEKTYALKEELAFHFKEKEAEVEKAQEEFNKISARGRQILVTQIQNYYAELVEVYSEARITAGLKPLTAFSKIDDLIAKKPIKDDTRLKAKKISTELKALFAAKDLSALEDLITGSITVLERVEADGDDFDFEDYFDGKDLIMTTKSGIRLTSAIRATGELGQYIRKFRLAKEKIARLEQEKETLAIDIKLSDKRYEELKKNHEDGLGTNSEIPLYERVRNICHLSQQKITDYLEAERDVLDYTRKYNIASANAAVIDRETKISDYCKSKAKYDKNGKFVSSDDPDVAAYEQKREELSELSKVLYDLDPNTNNFKRTVLNFLSRKFDSDLGKLTLHKDSFVKKTMKPRALPSVKLMGEGDDAVYLPTDTAPARTFSYSIMQRLVEPEITINNRKYTRQKLTDALDVMAFKENLYGDQLKIPMASSLGIGYILKMHQAWVPDGYSLGNLLYSLVLAPGEEQRIVVKEHTEAYNLQDTASTVDTINDKYSNSQRDKETAAFQTAADRYSSANSDSYYYTESESGGGSGWAIFATISSSYASSYGESGASATQRDNYDEISLAAQNFQSTIQTEASRISSEHRASISIASSEDEETLSSKIIANHNHSHVMTVQYWEVMRRYCLETCIEGVDLTLFVPLKPIQFLPNEARGLLGNFSRYTLDPTCFDDFTKSSFNFRYGQLLRYADYLSPVLPWQYSSGLELIKKYASYPTWTTEKSSLSNDKKVTLKLKGHFMEFDNLNATLYFNKAGAAVAGHITSIDYHRIHPSMNKRSEVLYAMRLIRGGTNVEKVKQKVNPADPESVATINVMKTSTLKETEVVFTFDLPSNISNNDISYIALYNDISTYNFRLSQDPEYMEPDQAKSLEMFKNSVYNFRKDDSDSIEDMNAQLHYSGGLPECYLHPDVSFSKYELRDLGPIEFTATVTVSGKKDSILTPGCSSAKLGDYCIRLDVSDHIPVLGFNEIMKMEETLHHVAANTIRYSQVVWQSLTTNERILLLEPYTVEFAHPEKLSSNNSKPGSVSKVPLLNCVNAHQLLGFYGNCMILPFTYPKELAEALGKTASDIQDELYRYHTSNFRVPTTVVSVPTSGMVGEAVLGATNVSEKIDITRFWNWQDSDIDHTTLPTDKMTANSILENAKTQAAVAPTQGVTATSHIDAGQLVNALISRAQPTFANALENTDLREVLKTADTNTATGRDNVIKANTEIVTKAIETAGNVASAGLTPKKKEENNETPKPGEGQKPTEGGEGQKPAEGGGGDGQKPRKPKS